MNLLVTPCIKTDYADAFSRARKDRFRVVWLEDDLAYVRRTGPGKHDRYLIRFFVGFDGSVTVNCRTIDNTPCYGCRFRGMCAHIAVAILRWEAKHELKKAA